MFIDHVTVKLSAGKGGNGLVAWRREKYLPKGGPYGGNGGRGGDVVIEACPHTAALDWFRNRRLLKAEDGQVGGVNLRQGRRGRDLVLKVPCGTLVKDEVSGALLCDLVKEGQRYVVCQGGRGGRGNHSFRTPRRQAPNFATPGSPGEEKSVALELKLIADVGLVGFPNAGKSTLLHALTDVMVKTAPYPFTTLHPNLGTMESDDYRRMRIADIPGIIEGAHNNRGLGLEFLRHIERTKVLLFVLDASGIDGRHALDDYQVLCEEIRRYNDELLQRPYLVAMNKMDCEGSAETLALFRQRHPDLALFPISAYTGDGVDALAQRLMALVA